MALSEAPDPKSRSGRRDPRPVNVVFSSLGGWLRLQSRRPGVGGEAAANALRLLHGSALVVTELGDQLARATAPRPAPTRRPSKAAPPARTARRRTKVTSGAPDAGFPETPE